MTVSAHVVFSVLIVTTNLRGAVSYLQGMLVSGEGIPMNCTIQCDNGGTLNYSACKCECTAGYEGFYCREKVCGGRLCQYGGTVDKQTCLCNCVSPYYGVTCDAYWVSEGTAVRARSQQGARGHSVSCQYQLAVSESFNWLWMLEGKEEVRLVMLYEIHDEPRFNEEAKSATIKRATLSGSKQERTVRLHFPGYRYGENGVVYKCMLGYRKLNDRHIIHVVNASATASSEEIWPLFTSCPYSFREGMNLIICTLNKAAVHDCAERPLVKFRVFKKGVGQPYVRLGKICTTPYNAPDGCDTRLNADGCGCLSHDGDVQIYQFRFRASKAEHMGGSSLCTVSCTITGFQTPSCLKIAFSDGVRTECPAAFYEGNNLIRCRTDSSLFYACTPSGNVNFHIVRLGHVQSAAATCSTRYNQLGGCDTTFNSQGCACESHVQPARQHQTYVFRANLSQARDTGATIRCVVPCLATKRYDREFLHTELDLSCRSVSFAKLPQQTFLKEPEDVVQRPGNLFILKCSIANVTGEVHWTHNGVYLGTDRNLPDYDRFFMIGKVQPTWISSVETRGDWDLLVKQSRIEDSGLYQCHAGEYVTPYDKVQSIHSAVARVTVAYLPGVSGERNYTATEGSTLELYCRVWGKPEQTIHAWAVPNVTSVTWSKNGAALGPLSRYHGGTRANPSLTILRVEKEDKGTYRCIATNIVGFTRGRAIYVTVTWKDECLSRPCKNGATCLDRYRSYTCDCRANYTGKMCETELDPCVSGPCRNGAFCVNRVTSYFCFCRTGFTGRHCETEIDRCASSPCVNGYCHRHYNGYTCQCRAGFTGTHCQTDINECSSEPCQNGGTCLEAQAVAKYRCVCPPGYSGNTCQTNVNECMSAPCMNFGLCHDHVNKFTCSCPAGYTGYTCHRDVDECGSGPCQHGGTCRDFVNSYNCTCRRGYTGVHCATDVDECASRPCGNRATCRQGPSVDMYTCACVAGYTGRHCQTDANECATGPCLNGGTCRDERNKYTCICRAGFAGINCQTDTVDQCQSGPCHMGTCRDGYGNYSCSCPTGISGTNCEFDAFDACQSSPCERGRCVDSFNKFACQCPSGYTGTTCEIEVDECSSTPCLNGARCRDFVNRYRCTCTEGYIGRTCGIDIVDQCRSDPCLRGECVDGSGNYTCLCPSAVNGTICEEDTVDQCDSGPCLRGTCVDEHDAYSCLCPTGFAGTNCDIDTDECLSRPCQHGLCVDQVAGFTCTCRPGFTGTRCNFAQKREDSSSDWWLSPLLTGLGLGLLLLMAAYLALYFGCRQRATEEEPQTEKDLLVVNRVRVPSATVLSSSGSEETSSESSEDLLRPRSQPGQASWSSSEEDEYDKKRMRVRLAQPETTADTFPIRELRVIMGEHADHSPDARTQHDPSPRLLPAPPTEDKLENTDVVDFQ